MYFFDVVRRSGRSMRSAKARTILTALAIAVGGFTLTLTLAASNGVRGYADKLVASNFDPSELLVGKDPDLFTNKTSSKPKEYDESITSVSNGGNSNLQFKRITQADIAVLRKDPGIEKVRENYQVSLQYITRESQKRFTASAEAYNPAQKPEIKAGSTPNSGDVAAGSVLLPDDYLEPLGFVSAEDALGKTINLAVRQPFSADNIQALVGQQTVAAQTPSATKLPSFPLKIKTLKITAVTKKPATSFNIGARPLLLGSSDAQELNRYTTEGTADYQKFIYVYARIKNGADANQLRKVQDNLRAQGFSVQSVKDTQKQITQFINILQSIVLVFGVITLIASVFGIVNTQYISVLERTREIGLMKALGMRRRDIRRLFMLEAGWIGFLGGVIGALLGLVVGKALNPWITKKLDLSNTYLLIFKPIQIILLMILLIIVAVAAGFLPARKAAKLDPIDALRTE